MTYGYGLRLYTLSGIKIIEFSTASRVGVQLKLEEAASYHEARRAQIWDYNGKEEKRIASYVKHDSKWIKI